MMWKYRKAITVASRKHLKTSTLGKGEEGSPGLTAGRGGKREGGGLAIEKTFRRCHVHVK